MEDDESFVEEDSIMDMLEETRVQGIRNNIFCALVIIGCLASCILTFLILGRAFK